jgi:hypothetical protein
MATEFVPYAIGTRNAGSAGSKGALDMTTALAKTAQGGDEGNGEQPQANTLDRASYIRGLTDAKNLPEEWGELLASVIQLRTDVARLDRHQDELRQQVRIIDSYQEEQDKSLCVVQDQVSDIQSLLGLTPAIEIIPENSLRTNKSQRRWRWPWGK